MPLIDWTPFFSTWEIKGRYPDVLNNAATSEQARSLLADANAMLDRMERERWVHARGVVGIFPAIIGRLWPFEILWLAFFFSLIAWARRGTGMLTPIGIALAVGLPSLYYGLSGDWQAWWWWVFAVAATPTVSTRIASI